MTNSQLIDYISKIHQQLRCERCALELECEHKPDVCIECFNNIKQIIKENDKLKSDYDDIKINLDTTYRKLYDMEKLCKECQEEIRLLEEVLKDVVLKS